MFKTGRWRNEKNKFKAVFKLQFHATQLEPVGGDALMISLVPADFGKPTVRSEKAAIRDGSCYWENPVQETVKLFQDPKSGKIQEKMYYFVISTGSSKAGLVGEVSIDFASYAESIKPSSVSLPLKNTKCNSTLHVSIQRLQENVDQRDPEEKENTKTEPTDRSLKTQLRNDDADVNIKSNSTEDGPLTNKIPQTALLNGNRPASSGSDLTISSSESSSSLNTPTESPCPREVTSEDKSQESSEIMIEKLKTELIAVSRVAEVSELELQSLRKQIAKERKRGQDLSREVITLKEERDAFKEKWERRMDEARVENKLKLQGGNSFALVGELRQELNDEKDLNANLRLQLQKMQESNAELILALRDLDTMVEQKDKELCNLSNRLERFQENKSKLEMCDDEEKKALEEVVIDCGNAKEPQLPDQKSMEVYDELQRSRIDDLEMQMEQLSLDYEILKQENNELSYKLEQSRVQEQLKMQYECSSSFDTVNELESQIDNLESELEKRSSECLETLAAVTKLETQIENLEEEMEKHAQRFEADLEILMAAKVEQEQRAIRAEAALKKMRWQNLNTAERLQDELRRVLAEVAFTLEANEKMTTKAETEASELRLQKSYLEELVSKAKEEIQSVSDRYEAKLHDMQSEIEHVKKHEEETHTGLSQEILVLKAEIGRLEAENDTLHDEVQLIESLKDELEQMKTLMEEKEILLQRGSVERNDFESMIASLRKDAEHLIEELDLLRGLKDENILIIENLQLELDTLKSKHNESNHSLFEEIQMLKAEIGRLETENNTLHDEVQRIESLKDELEQMKTLMEEKEILLQRGRVERNGFESMIALLRKDVEHLIEELDLLRGLKDEKKLVIENLQLELDTLKSKHCESEHSLFEEIQMLKAVTGRLETENNALHDEVHWIESLKDELEQTKTLMEEKEILLQRGNMERKDFERTVVLLRKDAEKLAEELDLLRGLKDEKKLVIENLQLELDTLKSKHSESEHSLFEEIQMLKAEIGRLETENNALHDEVHWIESLKDELEQTKTLMEEKEILLQRGNMERKDFERTIVLLRKDAEKLAEELDLLRGLKDENKFIIENLQLELDTLKSKHNESKDSLFKDDLGKEKLRNQVCQVDGDQNAEDSFSNLEKQLKDNEAYCLVAKDSEGIALNGNIPEEVKNPSMMHMGGSCDEVSLGKEMEASIFSTLDEGYRHELLKEMELLREKNTSMEGELKQMHDMYSEISLKFAEVEGERQRLLMTVRNRKNRKKNDS